MGGGDAGKIAQCQSGHIGKDGDGSGDQQGAPAREGRARCGIRALAGCPAS
jgi:hypothetical protein